MIIISDLHMGGGTGADDFRDRDIEFLCFLHAVKDAEIEIGIAGDLLELWQTDLESIKRAHGSALRELMRMAAFYVVGNHDQEMLGKRLYGVEGIPEYKAGELYVEHGHQHDPVVASWSRTAAAVVWAVGYLERWIHPDCEYWAQSVWHKITGTGRHGENTAYFPKVAKEALKRGCSTAAFGHTHEWASPKTIGGTVLGVELYNSGTWVEHQCDMTLLSSF